MPSFPANFEGDASFFAPAKAKIRVRGPRHGPSWTGSRPDSTVVFGKMPRRAHDFPEVLIRALRARVGDHCSNPDCQAGTAGPHSDPNKAVVLGEAAHITANAPGGPRYDPRLGADERRSALNAIWLCNTCATHIDRDPERYPVEHLLEWKRQAERDATDRLVKRGSTISAGEDLVMVGVDVAFYASCDECSDSEWSFIPKRFILGDEGQLWQFIQRFHYLHEAFQTVTSNHQGKGKRLRDAPWRGREGRLHLPISQPVRKSFSTLAMKDGDLDLRRGVVSGADATHSQMEFSLNSYLGAWPMAPYTGSQISRFYHNPALHSDQTLFSEVVKAEMLRLSVDSVKSVLWIGDVQARRQTDPKKAVIVTCVVDGVGGPKIDSNMQIQVSDDPPKTFDIFTMISSVAHLGLRDSTPRTDRVLAAIQSYASGKRITVSLQDLNRELGSDAQQWDIPAVVRHLIARGDVVDAKYDGDGDAATLTCTLTSSHGGLTIETLVVEP